MNINISINKSNVIDLIKQHGYTVETFKEMYTNAYKKNIDSILDDFDNNSIDPKDILYNLFTVADVLGYKYLYSIFPFFIIPNNNNNKPDNTTNGTLLSTNNNTEINNTKSPKSNNTNYEHVNHPSHYNKYPIETIDMMKNIFGVQKLIDFCYMTAFKYRMRMGTKPDNSIQQDLQKESWYLNKAAELQNNLKP